MAAVNRLVALASLLALLVATGRWSEAAAVAAPGAAPAPGANKSGTGSLEALEFPSDFVALTSESDSSNSPVDNQGSATKRKVTRQIFDGETSGEESPEKGFSPFSRLRKEKGKRKTEEFDGFPDGFVTGLKPFNFEETAGTHRDSTSTGFFQFPEKDNLPSFATTLGGLTRFPPLTAASSSSSSLDSDGRHSDGASRARNEFSPDDGTPRHHITPDSFRDNSAASPPIEQSGGSSKRGRTSLDDGNGDYFPYGGGESSEDQRGRSYLDRSEKRLNGGGGGDGTGFGEESRKTGKGSTGSGESGFAGFTDYEGPSAFRSAFPAEDKDSPSELSYTRQATNGLTGDREEEGQGSSHIAVTAAPPSSAAITTTTTTSPISNFRDSSRNEARDSQNFVPIGHFQNGRFAFHDFGGNGDGGFRPLVGNSQRPTQHDEPSGHAVRNFRQTSRPHFFITNEGTGSNFDGNFFGGGGGDFRPETHHHQQPSSAEGFQQPQFHFEQPSRRPHQQFHGDDVTNHHSSASTNLLGSGNFNIIRGGIFADDENPSSSFQSFRPNGGNHNQDEEEGPKDFFHGFRDFQPFGGSLNNALSLNSQNIQKAPSNQQAVTAQTTSHVSAPTPQNSKTSSAW